MNDFKSIFGCTGIYPCHVTYYRHGGQYASEAEVLQIRQAKNK